VSVSVRYPIKRTIPVLVLFLFVSFCHGEDWTVKGAVYHNVKVTQIEPDRVHFAADDCLGSFALTDLPPELQKRFSEAAQEAKEAAKIAEAAAIAQRNAETDPIAHLVAKLSSTRGMWKNGWWSTIEGYTSVHLSKTENVPAKELVARVRFLPKDYRILRVEHLRINDSIGIDGILQEPPMYIKIDGISQDPFASVFPNPYTEVLVQTNAGDKILVFEGGKAGWWSFRTYDSSL
jgi:hypothetical protein